jgi:chloramphenicol-sensitive protein RarD
MVIQYGKFPWIAIFLAFSFGIYGLVRKVVQVDSIVGLGFETAILTPIALIYLINAGINGDIVFVSIGLKTTVLLMTAGIVTALPLIWLVCGVKNLPLKTIGFCQYLAPSMMLVIGILVYNEPFTHMYRITFSFIWSAVIVYLLSNFDFIKKLGKKVNLKGFHG